MVDEINGGDLRVWQWTLLTASKKKSLRTELRDDGFTLYQGDASLNCTFVTPLGSKPVYKTVMVPVGQLAGKHRGFGSSVPRISVEGKGHFVAVITISKGEHPKVTASSDELDATISVGETSYSYDSPSRTLVVV